MKQLFRGPARRWAPYLYLMVVACAVSWVHVAKYTVLSPIDELRHLDYALEVSQFNLPRLGDPLQQEGMRIEACRGIDLPGWADPPCDTKRFRPRDFRDDGYQTATPHPPGYYFTVGVFGRFIDSLGLSNDKLGPMRLAGGLFLGLGLCLTYLLGARLRIRASALLAALTFVPLMPAALHSSATVNPDAVAVLAGAIVLLAAVAWEQRKLSLGWLGAAAALATFLKFTNFLGVLVVAGYFLVRARPLKLWREARERRRVAADGTEIASLQIDAEPDDDEADDDEADDDEAEVVPDRRSDREHFKAACTVIAVGIAVALAWIVIDRLRATITPYEVPQTRMLELAGIPRWRIVFSSINVFAWLPPRESYIPFATEYLSTVQTFLSLLFAGSVIVAALRFARSDRIAVYGAVALLLGVGGGPAFVLFSAATSDIMIFASSRYGMSLFPVMVVVVAAQARTKVGRVVLWSTALICLAVTIGTMVTSPTIG